MSPSTEFGAKRVSLVVREAIASILPNLAPDAISGEESLRDLGADSVDRVEIILTIMNRLGIDEPMSNFSNIPNIDALVCYLSKG